MYKVASVNTAVLSLSLCSVNTAVLSLSLCCVNTAAADRSGQLCSHVGNCGFVLVLLFHIWLV